MADQSHLSADPAQESPAGPLGRATGERIFALVLVAVGVVAIEQGLQYGFIREDGIVGPGFVPVLMGGLLALMGICLVIRPVNPNAAREPDPIEEMAREARAEAERAGLVSGRAEGDGDERSALIVFAMIGAALLLSELIGITLALGVLAFVIMWRVEKVAAWRSALVAMLMTAAVWGVFGAFLSVPLNLGLLSQ